MEQALTLPVFLSLYLSCVENYCVAVLLRKGQERSIISPEPWCANLGPGVPTSIWLTPWGPVSCLFPLMRPSPVPLTTCSLSHQRSQDILLSSIAFTRVCSLFKLLCIHSFAHTFNRSLVRASCVPPTWQSAVSESIYPTRQGLSEGQDRTGMVPASFLYHPGGGHLAGFP